MAEKRKEYILGIIYWLYILGVIYWLMGGTLQSPNPHLQDTPARQAHVLRERLTFWPSWYSLKDLWRKRSSWSFLAELHLWGSCIAMYVEKRCQESMWLKVCSSKQFTKAATEGSWRRLPFGLLIDQWSVICKREKEKPFCFYYTEPVWLQCWIEAGRLGFKSNLSYGISVGDVEPVIASHLNVQVVLNL